MHKYVLRPEISQEIIRFLGLPFDSIQEKGVFYLKEENITFVGDDDIEHNYLIVWFKYTTNDNNEVIYSSWPKRYFDLVFVLKNIDKVSKSSE